MTTAPETTRLNKYIAHHSGISRREADNLITAGRVQVDDTTAALGTQVARNATVMVDGKPLSQAHDYTYLALHKPAGYVCSRKRQGDTPTIYELLPADLRKLKPVGRLDKDSSGLILLTDDGDFAHRMTHPSFRKTKVYQVTLDTPLQPLHHQMISDTGISLEDGISKFTVSTLEHPKYEIIMSEGRNRQIRRTFQALGYTVTKLHRQSFGSYQIESLKKGNYKTVS